MRWTVLLVVLVARIAGAVCDNKYPDNCRILFNGGVNLATNLNQCTEFVTPTSLPPLGKQFFYCKASVGICSVDAAGTERCFGGAGGGATVVISATPPASPSPGWLWWDTISGNLFIYYNDGTSSQWVPATATAAAASDIVRSSLAPFACSASTAGMYDDVDCKQLCVCAGWLGTPAWCRSDTGLCGTSIDCCSGTTTTSTSTTTTSTSTTTTTTLIVPAALASDTNCPATLPVKAAAGGGMLNTLWTAVTCPTPAFTTTAVAVSVWADNGTVGTHIKCSVYNFAGGYISGSTSVTKVAAGCDTVEYTTPTATVSNWVALATTGSCPLAASTRYLVGCNADAAYQIGYNNNTCTLGSVQCQQIVTASYATNPLPTPWTAGSQGTATVLFALGVR